MTAIAAPAAETTERRHAGTTDLWRAPSNEVEKALFVNFLSEYQNDIRYRRARLMRCQPFDYRAVRNLDYELDVVVRRLREIEADI